MDGKPKYDRAYLTAPPVAGLAVGVGAAVGPGLALAVAVGAGVGPGQAARVVAALAAAMATAIAKKGKFFIE